MEILDIIERLNSELRYKAGFDNLFYYKTDGSRSFIYSGDKLLWDSDDDNRKLTSLGKYEDMEIYLQNSFNKYINDLNRLKFEL